jgi:ATP-dependent DNA helicase DinG
MSIDPAALLGPDGRIASRLAGYEVRHEQLQMAEAVARAITSESHLMVEAGTGVGKSFAYLVPAILAATELGKKIVVSTRTINLQEQLIGKDIPFLRSVMPREFATRLVKGRSNYISIRRLEAAVARAGAAAGSKEANQLTQLLQWSRQTKDGSRSDLSFAPLPEVWDTVESDSGNCLKQACPRYRQCFFFKTARRTRAAQVFVVNHALYMSDLALKGQGAPGVLPEHDVVIFDEAHELADIAAAHLGLRVASGAIANLLNSLDNPKTKSGLLAFHHLEEAQLQVRRTLLATDAFFDSVAEWKIRHGAPNGRVRSPTGLADPLSEELRKLATAIGQHLDSIEAPEQKIELESAKARSEALARDLTAWLRHDVSDSVYWVDVTLTPNRSVVLACSPLDLGPVLRRDLFDRVPTCVLTSATLSVGTPPDFRFAKSRLGLSSELPTMHLGSPFDFQRQVTLYLAKGLPDPSSQSQVYESAAIRAIPQFVRKTQGKALVLFTSHQMMNAATRSLGPWFRSQKITLLSQSSGTPSGKLLNMFRSDINSVLFGTDGFWQGVDVPGEALSSVIITRLPFDAPTEPLLEARLEEITRRGGEPVPGSPVAGGGPEIQARRWEIDPIEDRFGIDRNPRSARVDEALRQGIPALDPCVPNVRGRDRVARTTAMIHWRPRAKKGVVLSLHPGLVSFPGFSSTIGFRGHHTDF